MKCYYCSIEFDNKDEWARHIQRDHNDEIEA